MQSIKHNSRFRTVYSKGESIADRYLVLYKLASQTAESHLGITVSGKVGKAVVRNKIKRQIKEIIRLSECPIKEGYDIIFLARRPAPEANYADLKNSVMRLLKKMDLLKEEIGNE